MISSVLSRASTAFLGLGGAAFLFAADDILPRLIPAFPPGGAWLGQLLGAAWIAVAALNWLSRSTLLGGIYGRGVVLTNTMLYFIGAMVLVKVLGQSGTPRPVAVLTVIFALFAMIYGWLLFRGPFERDMDTHRRAQTPRGASLLIMMLLAQVSSAGAQALNPDFVYGRDYTFDRMEATRVVRDAQDSGTIRLVSYVYRPVKNDRHEVVLFSHGSTGGIVTSPREPGAAPPAPVVRFFVSRGYTLVAPQRRGRNESTGTYVEECSVFVGECTVADQLAITDRALQEALLDTYAVIDQVILGRLAPNGKILAAGWSRGGFLSLLLAGERPQLVKGVVNFSGGWHGVTDRLSAADNKARMDVQTARLTQAAKRTSVPSFWIYAVRDPLSREGVPQELVRSWRDGGGQAEFVYITEHTMENAHQVPQNPGIWERQLDAFLQRMPR